MRTDLALAALASAAVPGMKPVAVAAVSPGDDELAAELQSAVVEDATGRRWVVRCPLSPVAGARLLRNDELVRHLSRHLPFKVPAAVGQAPVGQDGHAVVYPHVEGSPLELRRLPAGPGLASAVGRALAAVHNIPRAVFEEQDVPVFDASGARQRAVAEVDRAAETGRVPSGLLARWEEAFEAAPLWQFATTPVHGAFSGARVVVAFTDETDASTGRVVAVTDWDEAMVGDPAVDLAELYTQTSRQAWDAVLDSYTLARAHRPDPYLHARARLVAELRHLRGLARAVAEDDDEGVRRVVEVLRRVDRLTEADDSLVPVTARASGASAQTTALPTGREHEQEHEQELGRDQAHGPAEDLADDATTEVPAPPRREEPHPQDPSATAEDASPDHAWDGEVLVPGSDEGAPVHDEGHDDRHEDRYDDRHDAGGPGDADLTVQIPVDELGLASPGDDLHDEDLDLAQDEHDVHRSAPEGRSRAADPREDEGARDPAGPTHDDVPPTGDDHDPSATTASGADPSATTASGAADPFSTAPARADDDAATPSDDGAATAGPAGGTSGGTRERPPGDRREEDRRDVPLDEMRDDERLQELYGMPAPEPTDRG